MNGEWTESLGAWLLRTSIEGSILIAAVLGLSMLLGRHLGPRWRVVLWTLVGLKLLIPAFVPATPGLGNWLSYDSGAEAVDAPVGVSEIGETLSISVDPFEIAAAAETPVTVGFHWSFEWLAVGLWGAGVIAFVLLMMIRQRRFVSRTGQKPCRDRALLALVREVAGELEVRRDIPVVMSPEGSTPAVFGAWRPRLLLPADWNERFDRDSLRHILMHEIEHIRYRDVLWNWAAAAVNAVHWFNPLVWIAVSRFQSDRELRCDAGTVSRLQPAERIAYGQTLLRVQKQFIAAPAIAGVAPCVRNHPTLRHRILMITNPTDKKTWLNAILMLALAGLTWFSFGAASADDERSSREGSREKSPEREGERGSREGARDGGREGGARSPEGERQGARDGDRPREGSREGDRPREGDREGSSRGREGARDGEGADVRDGEIKVSVFRDGVVIGDVKMRLVDLRKNLDRHKASSAVIVAQPDVPFQSVTTVMNSLKNSGIKNIRIGTAEDGGDRPMRGEGDREGRPSPEAARDGEGGRRTGPRDGEGAPRTGPRDGEGAPRTGPRDGEGAPRTGPRDGEGAPSREGARDGDRPKEGSREGAPSREGAREGDRPREGSREGEGGSSREGGSTASSANMDDKKIAQFTRIYRAYDKDGSGGVTFEEWVAMKNYKLTSDQEKREKGWFDQADSGKDGKVSIGEWIDWKNSQ